MTLKKKFGFPSAFHALQDEQSSGFYTSKIDRRKKNHMLNVLIHDQNLFCFGTREENSLKSFVQNIHVLYFVRYRHWFCILFHRLIFFSHLMMHQPSQSLLDQNFVLLVGITNLLWHIKMISLTNFLFLSLLCRLLIVEFVAIHTPVIALLL